MNGIGLFFTFIALFLGFALGAFFVRSRTAGIVAERDSARAELTSALRGRDAAEQELRESVTQQARLEEHLAHARSMADEKVAFLKGEQERLAGEFERLSTAALRQNRDEFLQLANERWQAAEERSKAELEQRRTAIEAMVKPLADHLGKVSEETSLLERNRAEAYAELREQVKTMTQRSEELRTETSQLVTALRAPQVRGRWGEMQLRRVVENAGMVEHVDFTEQTTVTTDDGIVRPDLVVRICGDKNVVVDAKVAFSGYLEAMEAPDDTLRQARLDAHARHVKTHIDTLGAKKYWEQFSPSPEFVIMFVPAEVFLSAALERDPALLEHAFDRNVVLATPTTLVAMLRTVAYTWRQDALTRNAQDVLDLGKELHSRLSTLGGHISKLGRQLDGAVRAYNDTVSSLESRVLVSARKMTDLKVVDDDLEPAAQIERAARQPQAPELAASADQSLIAIDDIERDPRYGVNSTQLENQPKHNHVS